MPPLDPPQAAPDPPPMPELDAWLDALTIESEAHYYETTLAREVRIEREMHDARTLRKKVRDHLARRLEREKPHSGVVVDRRRYRHHRDLRGVERTTVVRRPVETPESDRDEDLGKEGGEDGR